MRKALILMVFVLALKGRYWLFRVTHHGMTFCTRLLTWQIFLCASAIFFATKNDNHIHYQELIEKTNDINCKKIVLNHLSEEMLSKKDEVKLALTKEGESITV